MFGMKHALSFAILLFSAASIWAVVRSGVTPRVSISLHVARTKISRVVFGVTTLVATALLGMNIFGWLLPHYTAGCLSYTVFTPLLLCFIVTAVIPHVKHTWREPTHNLAAWGIVYVVPVALACILFWPLSTGVWWCVAGLLLVECILLFLALTFRERFRPWFLYFQFAYLAVFFTALLIVTYC